MAREKFQTLTEQMFYILLVLRDECCGVDIMEKVRLTTEGRVIIGPGTLYTLLDEFCCCGWIRETKVEGRRRSYQITTRGKTRLEEEYQRLLRQAADYRLTAKEGGSVP